MFCCHSPCWAANQPYGRQKEGEKKVVHDTIFDPHAAPSAMIWSLHRAVGHGACFTPLHETGTNTDLPEGSP